MKTPLRFCSVLALCLAAIGFTSAAMALDGFTMKYGQMVVTRGGREMAMLDDMKMANGILVMSDGVVIRPNGNRFSIHDGDYLSLDGVLYRGGFPATPVTTTVTSSTTTVVAPVAPMTVVVATPAASAITLVADEIERKLEIHFKRRSFLSGLKKKQQVLATSNV